MLNHNGLHFGKLAMFDPRTDMVIMNVDEINKQQEINKIPEFVEWVYRHEKHHHGSYVYRSIEDIATLNFMINTLMFEEEKTMDEKISKAMLRYNAVRSCKLVNDIDPILDAHFVLEVSYKRESWEEIDDEGFATFLSENLADPKTKQIYQRLEWLYDKSNEILERGNILTNYVISYSLNMGLNPLLKFPDDVEYPIPSETFWRVSNTLVDLYDTNPEEGTKLFKKIKKRSQATGQEYASLEKELQWEITEWNPGFNLLMWIDDDNEKFKKRWHEGFRTVILGSEARSMNRADLIAKQPLIMVELENDEIHYKVRTELGPERYSIPHHNLLFTHVQDCLYQNKKTECFFCKCGVPICNAGTHEDMEIFENYMKDAFSENQIKSNFDRDVTDAIKNNN